VEDFEHWPFGLNPYDNDPGAWGPSLVTNAEPVVTALEAAEVGSVTEIGAYAGDFTRLLLRWGGPLEVSVAAVDPSPQPELEQLAAEHAELSLVRETSLAALKHIPLSDAIVIDGDHNYYTVSEELRRIAQRSRDERERLPLILLHDVGWPHGRRDDYFDPDQIPAEHRQPVVEGGGLYPGVKGTREGALPYRWPAAQEGGERNGVLTAVEDFVAAHSDPLKLVVIPSFYGLGVLWPESAPYSAKLAERLAPLDRNPLLARLERNRVLHLASSQVQLNRAGTAEKRMLEALTLLENLLLSRAFAAAELVLRLRSRGRPEVSRAKIRQLLGRD
jgi:hypothetical protein